MRKGVEAMYGGYMVQTGRVVPVISDGCTMYAMEQVPDWDRVVECLKRGEMTALEARAIQSEHSVPNGIRERLTLALCGAQKPIRKRSRPRIPLQPLGAEGATGVFA